MITIRDKNNQPELTLLSNRFFRKKIDDEIDFLSFYDGNLPDSFEIKAFIADIFYKHYRAKISVSFPELLAVLGKNNEILAALGMRSAADQPLFLEQYLDDKIENILSKNSKNKIERRQIIEIGSLAASKKNVARFLYITLAAYLKKAGYKYVVITGTKYLQKYFRHAGLAPQIIAKADKNRLLDQSTDWGNYYRTDPQVMVLNVDKGYFVLRLFLGISVAPTWQKLYPFLNYE